MKLIVSFAIVVNYKLCFAILIVLVSLIVKLKNLKFSLNVFEIK